MHISYNSRTPLGSASEQNVNVTQIEIDVDLRIRTSIVVLKYKTTSAQDQRENSRCRWSNSKNMREWGKNKHHATKTKTFQTTSCYIATKPPQENSENNNVHTNAHLLDVRELDTLSVEQASVDDEDLVVDDGAHRQVAEHLAEHAGNGEEEAKAKQTRNLRKSKSRRRQPTRGNTLKRWNTLQRVRRKGTVGEADGSRR